VAKSWAETDMNGINIDALSEDELVELNHKIVARLRFLSQMRSHSEMLDFRIGEKVRFHPSGHRSLPRADNTGMSRQGCSPSWIRKPEAAARLPVPL